MSRLYFIVLLASCLCDHVIAASIDDELRGLLHSYDQVVEGNTEVAANLEKIRSDFAKEIGALTVEELGNPRNRRAALIFVLSGGDASVFRPILKGVKVEGPEGDMMRGLLAYANSKVPEASQILLAINPLKLEPLIGGHLALLQALICAQSDPEKALKYLDIARLLLPGTLVEESALRHTLILAAKMENAEEFTTATRRYLRRFYRSSYAPSFYRQFIVLMLQLKGTGTKEAIAMLNKAIPRNLQPVAQELFISVMEHATLSGNVPLALAASEAVQNKIQKDSEAWQRFMTYRGAALIVDNYDAGLAMLQSVDRTKLSEQDLQLLDASFDISRGIKRTAKKQNSDTAEAINGASLAASSHRDFPRNAAMDHASRTLSDTDKILGLAQ